jgi:hypothetical protein
MQFRVSRSLAVVLGAGLVGLFAPAAARADAVTQWNINASAAIFASNPTAHVSTLSFAMVQGAVYDAVNAIDGGYQPYLVRPQANPWDSEDAAVATAAYRVLVAVVPSSQTVALANLAAQYTAALAAIPPGPAKDGGVAAGEAAAAAMLAARANDGRNPTTPFPFVFGTTPGVWRVSPPLTAPDPTPWVGNVKPFLVPSAEMLRTNGPNALTSKAYARDYNEIKSIGSFSSTTRTADETNAAIFWQSQPLGLYSGVMRSLSARFGLTTAQNARLAHHSSQTPLVADARRPHDHEARPLLGDYLRERPRGPRGTHAQDGHVQAERGRGSGSAPDRLLLVWRRERAAAEQRRAR